MLSTATILSSIVDNYFTMQCGSAGIFPKTVNGEGRSQNELAIGANELPRLLVFLANPAERNAQIAASKRC